MDPRNSVHLYEEFSLVCAMFHENASEAREDSDLQIEATDLLAQAVHAAGVPHSVMQKYCDVFYMCMMCNWRFMRVCRSSCQPLFAKLCMLCKSMVPPQQRVHTKLVPAGIDTQTQACLDDAFRTLEQLQVESHNNALKPETGNKLPGAATSHSSSCTVLNGSKEELQKRLVQSATIMRKLYTRNSALESQLAILQAPQSGNVPQSSTPPPATEGGVGGHQGSVPPLAGQDSMLRPSTTPARGQILTPISLLHQKDAVIGQLQAALSSSQRQVGLLRAALERGDTANASSDSRPCARKVNRSARQVEPSSSNLRSGAMLSITRVAQASRVCVVSLCPCGEG